MRILVGIFKPLEGTYVAKRAKDQRGELLSGIIKSLPLEHLKPDSSFWYLNSFSHSNISPLARFVLRLAFRTKVLNIPF